MRVGLDIGGTKIDGVAVTDDGEVRAQLRVPSGFGADEVVTNAASAVALLAKETASVFESIGVGIPGLVDSHRGHVRHAVNLGFEEFGFGPELESRVGVPVTVENDVNAAALGASHLMDLTGPTAYLNLGTGLAAGFVIDGRLWQGARGVSGEIGHIPVEPDGVLCPCGQRGCLETIASGSAIARQWPGGDLHPVQSLFLAADAGDSRAISIRQHLATGVAAAVRILILTIDVDTVVIGGGVSQMGAPLLDDIVRVFDEGAARSPFFDALDLSSRVRLMPPALPAAAVGAAMLPSLPRPVTLSS